MRKNLKLCPTKQYQCWAVTQAADRYLKILRTLAGGMCSILTLSERQKQLEWETRVQWRMSP